MTPAPRKDDRHPPSRRAAPELARTLELAQRVTEATGCPVVGGIAVALHGWPRHTGDIDIYSADFWETHQRLEAAGMLWDSEHREQVVDGVAIHMVGDDSLGGPPGRTSTIRGVKVIGLADLIRINLRWGLRRLSHAEGLARVIALIESIPLKKDFAAKLPTKLRAPFRALVEEVHGARRHSTPPAEFRRKYA